MNLNPSSQASRSLSLPAVLQIEEQPPCFGIIAGLSDQGLTFSFQSTPLAHTCVGLNAQLDFDLKGQHHSCSGLIVHIHEGGALLSLREATSKAHAALLMASRADGPPLGVRLSTLKAKQACHAHFMDSMQAVVDDFYRMLPSAVLGQKSRALAPEDKADFARLQAVLDPLRPRLIRHLTVAYPLYPGLAVQADKNAAETSAEPDEMSRIDDWIRRTTIAQQAVEPLQPLPTEFSVHYNSLFNAGAKPVAHLYQADAVLNVLAHYIEHLKLGPEARNLCYQLMAKSFQQHGVSLYQGLLSIVGEATATAHPAVPHTTTLQEWLASSAHADPSGRTDAGSYGHAPTSEQMSGLTALLVRLTENLGNLNDTRPSLAPDQTGQPAKEQGVPGMLARDRIFSRFLPALTPASSTTSEPSLPNPDFLEPGAGVKAVGRMLGGLSDLDQAARQGLEALMRHQPPIEAGPESLPQGSQIRALMLQAQGLLLEYTLNGLTYESQPDHPAWTLINALDALHQGADNHGQMLDQTLHHAVSLSMQWLLGQENVDVALAQVNVLLEKINAQLSTDRQRRRVQHLARLGSLAADPDLIETAWCVVKHDNIPVPYEVLGRNETVWALLDRSASSVLELPHEAFLRDRDEGLIEESNSFDDPYFERIADVTLTASLNAVHAFTWQDPASGCLKRSALIDELERRLAHPVTAPPTYCTLIEIPTMRPGLSSLPGDALAVLQKRTGEILLAALERGEHCGRLSDVSFMMVFAPQDPVRLTQRLSKLKAEMEALHPEWKLIGAVVPLVDNETAPTPSGLLRRANLACAPQREQNTFDLSYLNTLDVNDTDISPLPYLSLFLRCQQIAACREGDASHYEILLGVDEMLQPRHTTQSFVVMAEQSGSIQDLDNWVLRSTLEWMADNRLGMTTLSGLSVNLSGNSLTRPGHVESMIELLSRYPDLAEKLIFEVTETAAIDNLDVAIRALRALRKVGCRIALDDFGSGYSSYSYVRSLPLDYLKIDGTYIRNLLTDKTDQALTASMVDVAHALDLKVIAEYVDSEAVYLWLKNIGVDYVQGYWVHKPERLDGLVLS